MNSDRISQAKALGHHRASVMRDLVAHHAGKAIALAKERYVRAVMDLQAVSAHLGAADLVDQADLEPVDHPIQCVSSST
jgi:hypothetical protein